MVFSVHPMETALYSDMKDYIQRASQIGNEEYLLIHFFQPIGYSLWVWFWRDMANGGWVLLKLTHVFLVAGSVYFGWQTARRLLPASGALLVLLLLTFHVQWWQMASFAMSETLYTFLLTAMLWFSVRWANECRTSDAILVGLLFGVGFYVKGSAVFFPPLLLCWSIWRVARNKLALRLAVKQLLIMGASALAVAMLHGTFSKLYYGQFKLEAGATGGLNFVEGKCRAKYHFDSVGGYWLSPLHAYLGEVEEKHWDVPFSDQQYYWREGWKCIQENPVVVLTSLRYIYYLFAGNPLWPAEQGVTWYEVWFALIIVPLFLVGLLKAARQWDAPVMVPALLLLSLLLLAWVFKSELRYRVPFDAIIMIYAVLGVRTSWCWFCQYLSPGKQTPDSAR